VSSRRVEYYYMNIIILARKPRAWLHPGLEEKTHGTLKILAGTARPQTISIFFMGGLKNLEEQLEGMTHGLLQREITFKGGGDEGGLMITFFCFGLDLIFQAGIKAEALSIDTSAIYNFEDREVPAVFSGTSCTFHPSLDIVFLMKGEPNHFSF
ncbi:hypothetical protein ACJX0J_012401, partial [Zea mays]